MRPPLRALAYPHQESVATFRLEPGRHSFTLLALVGGKGLMPTPGELSVSFARPGQVPRLLGSGPTPRLTDAGWDVVRAVAPGHVDAVREAMFGPLTDEQSRLFGEALTAIVERLDPDHSLRVEHGADLEP